MEAALFCVVEVLKNAFLSTTFGMIFIGTNMLFSGFFRQEGDVPAAISWLINVVPLHWSFNGFTWVVFADQDFDLSGVPGVEIPGRTILLQSFGLHDVDPWAMFVVLLAYVVFFRIGHFVLLTIQTDGTSTKIWGMIAPMLGLT